MKKRLMMAIAVIATFAVSLNLHSSNGELVFNSPSTQMARGGQKYCAIRDDGNDCEMRTVNTVCISEDGKCGTGAIIKPGAPGDGSGSEDGNHGTPTN